MNNIASISVAGYPGSDAKNFDYLVETHQLVQPGSIVRVPFGTKDSLGVVQSVSRRNANDSTTTHTLLKIGEVLPTKPLPSHSLKLAEWLMDYYVASPSAVWRAILPSGIRRTSRLSPKVTTRSFSPQLAYSLNATQQEAVEAISTSNLRGHLLHGVTGSGKTEVYIELIRRCLDSGKSAMVLVPEIALTPQVSERLSQHFGDRLIVSHSKLTPARRKQIWLTALHAMEPRIYLGPRSTLFLPVTNLGLIVIDEEHESSYKQDNAPTYHANTVAAKLAELTGAKYILTSATPLIYSYHMAQLGKLGYAQLPDRATGAKLPATEVVRLSHTVLSPRLVSSLKAALLAGKQAILFLNRRGNASALLCDNCGHIEKCPRCDTSLAFHADVARLRCHYCGYTHLPPSVCPQCKQPELHFIGSGTKRIEQEVRQLFGDYQIRRLDSDNATLEYIEQLYQELRDGSVDIVIGTQMIARGLDIPNVTMVGVVLAESMLAIPDFSSNERTFELLTQVTGRAGRGSAPGSAIIQTHSTAHPAIVAASKHDYLAFYTWESANRKAHAYPPYTYLVKLIYGHKNAEKAILEAQKLADELRSHYSMATVLGPTDRAVRKVAGRHQQQVIVKARKRSVLTEIARNLKAGWKHDLDPVNLM